MITGHVFADSGGWHAAIIDYCVGVWVTVTELRGVSAGTEESSRKSASTVLGTVRKRFFSFRSSREHANVRFAIRDRRKMKRSLS
jgi:hypothetical protein